MQLRHIILGIRRDPGGDDDVSARRAASSWVLARRRGVTDVSPSRWVASLQSLPRLRATLSIATCFVLRTRAVRWFFWQRALSWRAALRCRARSLSRLHKRAWKSLKGDRPTGPTHGRLLLLRLSPWTFACARPPDAWRLPLVWCVVLGVSSSGVRRALPTGARRHVVPLAV